jgi:outer membrane protein
VDARSHEYAAIDDEMQITIQKKVFSVRRSYFEVLKSESFIRIQQENVKISKQQLKRAERYFDAGLRTKVDISTANVVLFDAEQNLKRAEYDKKLAAIALIREVGYVPQRGEFRIAHKKVPRPSPSKTLPRKGVTLPSLQSYAFGHRYELQQQESLIKSAAAVVLSQEADYYPTLTLDANALAQSLDSSAVGLELLHPSRRYEMGLNFHWNLFEGYKTDSRVQEAKINKLRSMSAKQIVKLQIRKEVADAYFLLQQSKDLMELAEGLVKASNLKYEQTQRRYESDLADYIELQDAQKDYVVSRTSLANSYYDYYIALALVDLAIGKDYR